MPVPSPPTTRTLPTRWRARASPEILVAAALVLLALVIRYRALGYESPDYRYFLKPWAQFITDHGGFRALRYEFANYNMPYLYILSALTYVPQHLPVTLLTAIKTVSVFFDAVLAVFTVRIVALRYAGWKVPLLAGLLVLLLPTVTANSAVWGQCDAVYAAFAVAGLYYLLRDRPWVGCALLGLAYAVKQQAIFIFPVLLVLVLARRLPWRALLAIPAVFLVLDVPAALLGRPVGDLLSIYADQVSTYRALSLNAPSVYAFFPGTTHAGLVSSVGILFTAAVFMLLAYAILASRISLTTGRVVLLATASSIIAPFLLPAMHERYFYLADVLTVIAAFHLPRRLWYVPMLVQAASFLSYLGYLLGRSAVDLRWLAVLMFVGGLATTYELVRPTPARAPVPPETAPPPEGDAPPEGAAPRVGAAPEGGGSGEGGPVSEASPATAGVTAVASTGNGRTVEA